MVSSPISRLRSDAALLHPQGAQSAQPGAARIIVCIPSGVTQWRGGREESANPRCPGSLPHRGADGRGHRCRLPITSPSATWWSTSEGHDGSRRHFLAGLSTAGPSGSGETRWISRCSSTSSEIQSHDRSAPREHQDNHCNAIPSDRLRPCPSRAVTWSADSKDRRDQLG